VHGIKLYSILLGAGGGKNALERLEWYAAELVKQTKQHSRRLKEGYAGRESVSPALVMSDKRATSSCDFWILSRG
jgi:hypothetical protein